MRPSESESRKCLQQANGNVQLALDKYFESQSTITTRSSSGADAKKQRLDDQSVAKLFAEYKDPKEEAILVEGTEKLCSDLGVAPDDVALLVLAWHFQLEKMCCFTRQEFTKGMAKLGFVLYNRLLTSHT